MVYYSSKEIEKTLNEKPQYRSKLFCRGFLITNNSSLDISEYPFYGYWNRNCVQISETQNIYFFTHYQTKITLVHAENAIHFLIGHAYNPYSLQFEEEEILQSLAASLKLSVDDYWKEESKLTGIFCIGFIQDGKLVFSTDATGMQLVFYGTQDSDFYISSHSKLPADLCNWHQDEYIVRLVDSKFYRYWGTFLPGDLSPFQEMKRVQPNFSYTLNSQLNTFSFRRYFPLSPIVSVSDQDYEKTIHEIADILQNNLILISRKWGNSRAAISVTGGRDSTTTLASANSVYDKISYFSYISNQAEEVDAQAAESICSSLGLPHTTYTIPEESDLYSDIETVQMLLECNAGCIGKNNLNDVKKRIYLDTIHDFDIEIKSWVDELSRCEGQNKYQVKRFPAKPTAKYLRCMWKVIINPKLIKESTKIFQEFLDKYYSPEVFRCLPWNDLYYWEFSWSSGEGCFLTSEHKYSFDITIPFNNRCLLQTMFTVPEEKRMGSQIQADVIRLLDKRIEDTNIHVKDISHTDLWSLIIRTYLKIFSKF